MAKAKKDGAELARAVIASNPTWPDDRVHAALKTAKVEISREEVATVRAEMGDKHTWKD